MNGERKTLATGESATTIGAELRGLRMVRGLTLSESARRADLSPSALANWEAGRRIPSGKSLEQLLDALCVEARLKARILALVDPGHRSLKLGAPMGTPVFVGQILRAMRKRRRMSQSDLAKAIGVRQATVARWEIGENSPDSNTIHLACFALGASPEELSAVATAGSFASPEPFDARAELQKVQDAPPVLREVLFLGLEADLWQRATRDASLDRPLSEVIAQRAHWYLLSGRWGEVVEAAGRATAMATRHEEWDRVTHGVMAWSEFGVRNRSDTLASLDRLDGWIEKLRKPAEVAWALSQRSRLLTRLGQPDDAIHVARQGVKEVEGGEPMEYRCRRLDLAETYLDCGEYEMALQHLETYHPHDFAAVLRMKVIAQTALGEPAPERNGMLELLRSSAAESDIWLDQDRVMRVERTLARLDRRKRARPVEV